MRWYWVVLACIGVGALTFTLSGGLSAQIRQAWQNYRTRGGGAQ